MPLGSPFFAAPCVPHLLSSLILPRRDPFFLIWGWTVWCVCAGSPTLSCLVTDSQSLGLHGPLGQHEDITRFLSIPGSSLCACEGVEVHRMDSLPVAVRVCSRVDARTSVFLSLPSFWRPFPSPHCHPYPPASLAAPAVPWGGRCWPLCPPSSQCQRSTQAVLPGLARTSLLPPEPQGLAGLRMQPVPSGIR